MRKPKLDDLENSPLFWASLASKELFHSNFLGFLIKRFPKLVRELFQVDLGDTIKVERELKSCDLVLSGNGQQIVVENKVKDVAEAEQLRLIETRFSEQSHFILISLLGQNIPAGSLSKWREVPYAEIISALSKQSFGDNYIDSLVKDYVNFTGILIRELQHLLNCDSYIFYRTENEVVDEWKKFRLHDLYMKYGLSQLRSFYKRMFANSTDITLATSLNNSKPTATFWVCWNGIKVCVQIEDNQYRRAVISSASDLPTFERLGWFDPHYQSERKRRYLQYKDKEGDGKYFFYQIQTKQRVTDEKFETLCQLAIDDLRQFAPNIEHRKD